MAVLHHVALRCTPSNLPALRSKRALFAFTAITSLLLLIIAYFSRQTHKEASLADVKRRRMRDVAVMATSQMVVVVPQEKRTTHAYHIQHVTLFGGAALQLIVFDSYVINTEKCRNCLPNYFLKPQKDGNLRYREGTSVLVHHQKSGGTTLRLCLRQLVGPPDILASRNGERIGDRQFVGSMHTDGRLVWRNILSKKSRSKYKFIEGPNVMGICDEMGVGERLCSYYLMLRDPIDRAVSTYFYCKVEQDDQLCASRQMNATTVSLKEWVIHQRSFLLTQLCFDVRYCNMSRLEQQRLPCWYRQRSLMERVDVRPVVKFVVDDLVDRFAVIGMLDKYGESLQMFEKVYGIKFTQCSQKKENSMQDKLSSFSDRVLKQQVNDKDIIVSELRRDSDVRRALQFDISIYQKAVEIFEMQRESMARGAG
ncbi:uncharacterized protein LOC134187967 [Corticium candelabrum]|uniref:uncharacterized protein LOC134187967 n=1 Tax=Corticium candelabrum TaxID=121492 RepID=UPI002E270948|nr:uncharacterized protein LOC134187967 [Corticium candelabrum]